MASEVKQRAGALGGAATMARHGRDHMARIGRKGAEAFWKRYTVQPAGVSGWAIVERETGQVKARTGYQF